MAFDGIVTKAIVSELNKNILDSRTEKIYMPNKLELWFILHKNKEKYKLLISIDPSSARVQLSNLERANPMKAPNFCMVLRKYLQGNRIIKIEQHDLDRIIEFTFEGLDDFGDSKQKKLIIELMGKHSNVILTNDENKIIDSMKHVDNEMSSLREILPARTYEYPQNQERENFLGMSLPMFQNAIQLALSRPATDKFTFSQRLANEFTGFSRTFTNNLCNFCKIGDEISSKDVSALYSNLNILLYNIGEGLANLIKIEKDYHFDLSVYTTNSSTTTPVSDFLDEYYNEKETLEEIHKHKMELQKEVLSHICKYEKNLMRANEILTESADVETYKQYGEIISSNIYRMQTGMKELLAENFYNNNEMINIPLNESYSPSRNAQNYFKKYTKLKNAIQYATSQKCDYENNIDYLENISYQIMECTEHSDLQEIEDELTKQGFLKKVTKNSKKETNAPTQFIKEIKNGIEILIGKNNIQNEKLTFKIANKTDTWLHAKDIHGSHVIIRSSEVPEDVLLYAASLASIHSKAKGNGKVAVDYTLVKNVKKIPGAKPGKVTYTDYKTVLTELKK